MHTDHGRRQSQSYNEDLHLHTARHAILAYLRRPPTPFENALRAHWVLTAPEVKATLNRWVREASKSGKKDVRSQLQQVVKEVEGELDKLVAVWEGERQAAEREGAEPGGGVGAGVGGGAGGGDGGASGSGGVAGAQGEKGLIAQQQEDLQEQEQEQERQGKRRKQQLAQQVGGGNGQQEAGLMVDVGGGMVVDLTDY